MMIYKGYTDEGLFSEISKGDKQAFSELYNRFFAVLYSYAYKLTKEQTQAEDIVQEIFISLWDTRSTKIITGAVSTYLYTAVRYQFYKLVAKQKIRQDVSDELLSFFQAHAPDTDAEYLYTELQATVTAFAKELPGNMGDVFIKSRILEMTNREIADDLGLSEKTIRNQLSLANQHIRNKVLQVSHSGVNSLPIVVLLLQRLLDR